MRLPWMRRGWLASLVLCAGLLGAGAAKAIEFTLDVEFDDARSGAFARVEVLERMGGLDFSIRLLDDLGAEADLHAFYFNLPSLLSGLAVETLDSVQTDYRLSSGRPVFGGAGSRFDHGVHFGSGAGGRGNGTLQEANFFLSADQGLSVSDLLLQSSETAAGIDVQFALHAQSTSGGSNSDSETVGAFVAIIPEPTTALLLLCGLVWLAFDRRRRLHS